MGIEYFLLSGILNNHTQVPLLEIGRRDDFVLNLSHEKTVDKTGMNTQKPYT